MTQNFEELITELKEIVKKIEDGETSLDESIALYERGAVLITQCEKVLGDAELKICQLGRE